MDVVYYDGALVVPEDMSGVQILDNSMSPEGAGSEHEEGDKETRKRKSAATARNAGMEHQGIKIRK